MNQGFLSVDVIVASSSSLQTGKENNANFVSTMVFCFKHKPLLFFSLTPKPPLSPIPFPYSFPIISPFLVILHHGPHQINRTTPIHLQFLPRWPRKSRKLLPRLPLPPLPPRWSHCTTTYTIPIMPSTLPSFHSMVLLVCSVFVTTLLGSTHYLPNSYTQSHGENADIMASCPLGYWSTPSFILLFLWLPIWRGN